MDAQIPIRAGISLRGFLAEKVFFVLPVFIYFNLVYEKSTQQSGKHNDTAAS